MKKDHLGSLPGVHENTTLNSTSCHSCGSFSIPFLEEIVDCDHLMMMMREEEWRDYQQLCRRIQRDRSKCRLTYRSRSADGGSMSANRAMREMASTDGHFSVDNVFGKCMSKRIIVSLGSFIF